MAIAAPADGFERLTPRQARGVLALAAAVTLLLVGITASPLASGFADAPDRGPSDVDLYRAEVRRIQGGEGYYAAAAAELTARGYPTRSVFNWRPPLLGWLLGHLPAPAIGRALLALLALAAIFVATHCIAREQGLRQGLLCGLWLVGALLPCFLARLYVMHELWAGVLILLSILAYGAKRPAWGAVAGFAALLIRELAAPYCVLCFVLAVKSRRRREVGFWWIAAAIYALSYVAHIAQVVPRIAPNAHAHAGGWLCFGGAPFVISTAQMNGFLLLLPQSVAAVFLACALLGFAGWTAAWGQRAGLATCLYLALFAAIGHPFNQYWGSITAPLLALGAVHAPAAVSTLWRRATAEPTYAAPRPAA